MSRDHGDIVAEDQDIHADGINVAVRPDQAERGWPLEKVKALAKLYRRGQVGPKRQARTPTR